MMLTSQVQNQVLEIHCSGHMHSSMYADFMGAIESASGLNSARVNMQEVESIDSSGLGLLVWLRDVLGGDSAEITLLHASDSIQHILHIAQFQTLFNIQ